MELREIAESWFVVFDPDGDAGHTDDAHAGRAALLARETAETNTYRGFWTYRDSVVEDVLDRIRGAYLE